MAGDYSNGQLLLGDPDEFAQEMIKLINDKEFRLVGGLVYMNRCITCPVEPLSTHVDLLRCVKTQLPIYDKLFFYMFNFDPDIRYCSVVMIMICM